MGLLVCILDVSIAIPGQTWFFEDITRGISLLRAVGSSSFGFGSMGRCEHSPGQPYCISDAGLVGGANSQSLLHPPVFKWEKIRAVELVALMIDSIILSSNCK